MSSIEAVCSSASSLSQVQIHILKHSEELLQFASDLSHRDLQVLVPGRKAGTLVLAAQRMSLSQPAGEERTSAAVGTVLAGYEAPIALQVLQTGQVIQGGKELDYGRIEPMVAYPFVDNAGETMAVLVFIGAVEAAREVLTETAVMALRVPIEREPCDLYRPLSLQDGIILVNCNGVVIYTDEMAESIMHMRGHSGMFLGSNIYNTPSSLTGAKQVLATREGIVEDVTAGGVVFTRRVIPLLQGGKVRRVIVVLTEKTELYRKEEELMIKMSVIKEIHHRVKNNLQTIASLLRMQMRRTNSQEAKDVLKESVNRILSISLVHEILSHHDEEHIDIADVAQKLLTLLAHSMAGADCQIYTQFSGDALPLPSDEAASLALVLNETITNAIIHGFENRREGHLSVTIQCTADRCTIAVDDDGVGMGNTAVEPVQRKHLGLTIVRTLVEKDLKGTLEFLPLSPSGTEVKISFPITERG